MQSEPVKLIGRQTLRKQQLDSQLKEEQQQLADPFAQIILQLLQNNAILEEQPEQIQQTGNDLEGVDCAASEEINSLANLPQAAMQQQQVAAPALLTQPLVGLQQAITPQEQIQLETHQPAADFATQMPSGGAMEQPEGVEHYTPTPSQTRQPTLQQMEKVDWKQAVDGKEQPLQPGQQLKLEQAMRNMVEQIRNQPSTKEQRSQKKEELDIDALQIRVETHRAVLNEQISLAHTGHSDKQVTDSLEQQVAEKLYAGLASGKSEFTIRLNPKALGEVTVKLTEKDGQMTLRLSAVNEKTVKLLNNQLDALREAVRPMQVEVKQVVSQSQSADSQHLSQQMDMGGGQFFQQSNQAGQSFYRSSQQGFAIVEEPEEVVASPQQAMGAAAQIGQNMLDLYV